MRCNAAGNIFATGPSGVCVLTPDGPCLRRLLTGDRTANLCFDGGKGRTLFACVNRRVGMIRTRTKANGW
jgi:gluconolactonase